MLQKYDDSNPANQIELTSRFVWSHPAHMIATFFGAGLPSKAPGTYGSLAGALSPHASAPDRKPLRHPVPGSRQRSPVQAQGKKIDVLKYKAKKNEKTHIGHRQPYTKVEITKIAL